jgi:hypothetical protein
MATTIFPTPAGIVGVLADADVAFTGDGEAKFIAHLEARKSRGQWCQHSLVRKQVRFERDPRVPLLLLFFLACFFAIMCSTSGRHWILVLKALGQALSHGEQA